MGSHAFDLFLWLNDDRPVGSRQSASDRSVRARSRGLPSEPQWPLRQVAVADDVTARCFRDDGKGKPAGSMAN